MKTTATAAMETLLNVPPLDLIIQARAFATADRLVQNGLWTSNFRAGHGKICGVVESPVFGMPRDRMTPVIDFTKRFDATFLGRADWLNGWPTGLSRGSKVRFTDGSKTPNGTGAGVKYAEGGQFTKDIRIDGKVVIVTGCNSDGIGKETALELAKRGARVYMACRNFIKCEVARREIIELSRNKNVFNLGLDLTSIESIKTFVKEFESKEQSLDILINNAGVYGLSKRLTVDGHEITFASNYLGHFLLTNLLLEKLRASAPSRIVNVSSFVHKYGIINKNDLQGEKVFTEAAAYCNSKLANILFTREMAKRLAGTGVTCNSLHPGVIRTEIGRNSPLFFNFMFIFGFLIYKTVKSGAQTTLACAIDPEFIDVTGKYFCDCSIAEESKIAQDDEISEWLWRTSEKLTGMAD
ncbi:retinol dehydrogenase 12-like [Bradysia coprophila]|uniref:retinol dehydrogenase 12-like n=1 Tax=Bradysia coprophila TaxID=38358 RepID=UPI00187D9AA4|nr:retinol dehydrogenase 12-like [Bradysia coprophila]